MAFLHSFLTFLLILLHCCVTGGMNQMLSASSIVVALHDAAPAEKALAKRDMGWFAARLPSSEQWRLLEEFHAHAAYVDIETTGLSRNADTITVVAMHAEGRTHTFVHGKDMDEFPSRVSQYPLVVTFNGASFDMPFLTRRFKAFKPAAHIDLRHPLKRLGYAGGLKAIERQVGIGRTSNVRDIDGFEAVRLWHAYRRGDQASLDRLLEYARADVDNLAPLARLTAEKAAAALGFKKRECRWGGW